MSRIEAKDGKVSTKEKEKERKHLAKRLEPSVLCKQAKDSDLEEVEEKAKEEEKECPNRHSVRNVEAEEHAPGTEAYMHNPPNQDQYPRPNVVESGSIRQTTSRPDPRVVSRRVRGNFTPKPFYHIGTPPEEFPEVFPLNSEEEGEAGDDIQILYTRMVREADQKEEKRAAESLETRSMESEVEKGDDLGLCKGCGTKLELTCTRPSRSESSQCPRMPELYPGEDCYLRLQRKLRFEVKESLTTSKLWKIQQVENMSGLSFTWTWNARRKRNKKSIEFGWYVRKSFMMSLNGLSWMIPMAMMIGV